MQIFSFATDRELNMFILKTVPFLMVMRGTRDCHFTLFWLTTALKIEMESLIR